MNCILCPSFWAQNLLYRKLWSTYASCHGIQFNCIWFYYLFPAVLIWISTCHEAPIIQASLWISICWIEGWRKWLHIRTWSILLFPSFCLFIFPLMHMLISWILICTISISNCFRLVGRFNQTCNPRLECRWGE